LILCSLILTFISCFIQPTSPALNLIEIRLN
jgi:hypothetical protein